MKRVRLLNGFKEFGVEISNGFIECLKYDFYDLHNSLNNGEKLEGFKLPYYQNVVIFEEN